MPTDPENLQQAAQAAFDEYLALESSGEELDFDAFCRERPLLEKELRQFRRLRQLETAAVPGVPNVDADATVDVSPGSAPPPAASSSPGQWDSRSRNGPTPARSEGDLERGARIGQYRILEEIGAGGMGSVYLAQQERPVRRRVALKVIKLGMDTREVVARFEAERQVLAMMDHPNIAKVYDAGATEDGRPYFVMEHVRGVPLTDFCDREGLSLKERLELFCEVCRGLEHAHSRGIIHRDIKPSNILVSCPDEKPLAKIIDFGVAKATNQRLTEKTIYTEIGQAVGTPAYMSPEQAELTAEGVDRRTDIYSLGVVLYELLVGELPLDWEVLKKAAFDELLRRIREDEPPTPSLRWSRLNNVQTSRLARSRQVSPSSFSRRLRGDLDWITMKALEKEKHRRYASALEFARDVERHLKGDPVLARPPSALYRLKKYVRKNRGFVTAAAAVILVLSAGLAASLAMYFEVRRESAAKTAALEDAEWRGYVTSINAAALALERGNLLEFRRLLQSCPQGLRGWEWRHLELRADLSMGTLDLGGGSVRCVLTSKAGGAILAAAADAAVSWDGRANAATTIVALPREATAATCMAIRDDASIAYGLASGAIGLLRNAASEKVRGHDAPVTSVSLARDGSFLVSGSRDRTARVLQLSGDPRQARILEHEDWVSSVAISPRSDVVATGSDDASVTLWNPRTGDRIWTIRESVGAIRSLAFSASGDRLIAGSDDRSARLIDVKSGRVLRSLPVHDGEVSSVAIGPDGRIAATGSTDKIVRLWDLETGDLTASLRGHSREVTALGFSFDGEVLISGSRDGSLRTWDVSVSEAGVALSTDACFAPIESQDGRYVVTITGGSRRAISVWDGATGGRAAKLEFTDEVLSAAFAPDAPRLVVITRDATVHEVDTTNWAVLRSRLLVNAGLRDVAISPDTTLVAARLSDSTRAGNASDSDKNETSAGRVAKFIVVKCDSGDVIAMRSSASSNDRGLAAAPRFGRTIAFGPAQNVVAAGEENGRVTVLDLSKGQSIVAAEPRGSDLRCLDFHPTGGSLALGFADGRIVLHDLADHAVTTLQRHGIAPNCLSFSPDGTRVVFGFADGEVRIWSVPDGSNVGGLRGPRAHVTGLRFTNAADRLVVTLEPSLAAATHAVRNPTLVAWTTDIEDSRRLVKGVRSGRPRQRSSGSGKFILLRGISPRVALAPGEVRARDLARFASEYAGLPLFYDCRTRWSSRSIINPFVISDLDARKALSLLKANAMPARISVSGGRTLIRWTAGATPTLRADSWLGNLYLLARAEGDSAPKPPPDGIDLLDGPVKLLPLLQYLSRSTGLSVYAFNRQESLKPLELENLAAILHADRQVVTTFLEINGLFARREQLPSSEALVLGPFEPSGLRRSSARRAGGSRLSPRRSRSPRLVLDSRARLWRVGGTVRGGDSREGLAGARITVRSPDGTVEKAVRSDEHGFYRLDLEPRPDYAVTVSARGYTTLTSKVLRRADMYFALRSESTSP